MSGAAVPASLEFLRDRPRSYLARVVGDARFAPAAAAALVASTTATALPPVNLSDVAAGIGGFVINGIDQADFSGWSVSGAGDVNGDGLADLIVGAPEAGILWAGASYVVFGKADATPVILSDVAAGTGGFVINGIDSRDVSGGSVSGAGDVNGDGLADLIVGAVGVNFNPTGVESYVVFGKADTTPVNLSDVASGTGGFVINEIDAISGRGWIVSGAEDVNGDGLADLIVGAVGADPGRSYVVFGKADTTPVNLSDIVAGTGGFVINAGSIISGTGDVNGDGLADLIVGGGNTSAGESYVVFGKADTLPLNLADVAAGSGGFVMNGIDPGDSSGFSVSGAGDVNGDGLADLIVGAYGADPGGNSFAGESYVVFGPSCPWDCADGDGQVGIVDFLALLADWGGPGACDFDGGGIGCVDFRDLLAKWGPCP